MIKGLHGSADRYLADLARIEERQAKVQREISSGLKVYSASDAPDRVVNIVELRSSIERATTIDSNLQRVRAEVDTAEAAMQVAVRIVERARVLATQAATSLASDRKAGAIEVRQLHDQLVSLTRTVSEGRYVFSGDLDDQVLYEADWTQPSGVRRLASVENTRQIEDVSGSRFTVGKSAQELFDLRDSADLPTAGNAFSALHDLGVALENDDVTAVQAAATKVVASLEHLNRQLAFYGHTQNRLDNATDLTKKTLLARTRELSGVQDTDLAEALVNLNLAAVHQKAALGAHAQLPRNTLFDFLG